MIERKAGHLIRAAATALAICSTVALPGSLLVSASAHRRNERNIGVQDARNLGIDVDELIARSMSAASARNEAALAVCTSEISGILDREFAELHEAAGPTTRAVATSKNCLRLIALLASDTVRGRSDADDWVCRRINERLAPQVDDCQRQIQDAIDVFDRELAASTMTLATELAGFGGVAATSSTLGYQPGLEHLSANEALRFLGFEGVSLPPAIAIDVHNLMNNRVVHWLIDKTMDMARWIFARPIAAATAEATCVVVDGPLPFGDLIGLAGAVWTVRDVYTLRHRFRRKLVAGIEEGLVQCRTDLENDVLDALQDRAASHAAVQARIHDETARSFLNRYP